MPPPEEDESGALPPGALELKLESEELHELDQDIQNDESFERQDEGEQYHTDESDLCNYKNENIEMDQYESESYQVQTGKNSDLMDSMMDEGNSDVNFENMNNSGFEEAEPMEAEVSEQSSHQGTFFELPCEKREVHENSLLSDANMITESDDGFENYETEILQQGEESKISENESKTFYFKQKDIVEEDEEEEEEEEETVVQGGEYFQEEQTANDESYAEESEFIESAGFQNMEEYDSSEQVVETTESEIPAECVNETVDSVQSIGSEGSLGEAGNSKNKAIITKDNIFQLNQSNVTMKKFVQSPLKRPLLPVPGQSKNVITKVYIQGSAGSGSSSQPLKILQSGPTKTITLAQAQQMGLITSGAKIQQLVPSSSSGSAGNINQKKMIYKKIIPTCSSSLLTPSTSSKSTPTKILPAPSQLKGTGVRPSTVTAVRGPVSVANIQTIRGNVPVGTLKTIPSMSNSNRPVPVAAITALRQSGLSNVNLKPVGTVKSLPGGQKVIIRQGPIGPLKSGQIINQGSTGQVIRIPAASSFQPLQLGGGKQVQYLRLVSGSGSTMPTTTVINNAKSKIVKTPISQASYKAVPIAPNPNPTVKTVLPKPSVSVANTATTAKRILIPVSQGVSQLCIANDVTAVGDDSDGEKTQTITTVPVSALQQLKSTGSITAIPPSAVAHLRQGRNIATLTNSQFAQLKAGQSSIQIKAGESGIIPVSAVTQAGTAEGSSFVMSEGSIVMLPPELVQQIQQNAGDSANGETNAADATEAKSKPSSENDVNDEENYDKENIDSDGCRSASPGRIAEANGLRMKKPCNCTRSQCLKLYCECFANGEFCFQCNCNNCFNNIEHEEERQKSIKSCLERNPSAFRPKIQIGETEEDERRHNKGCHCKRSGCLKNYCECYEAKITCSKSCKCIGCRNTEEFLEGSRSGLIDLADAAEESFNEHKSEYILRPQSTNSGVKQPYNFMSSEVVEATCQCLLAQAEEAERNGLTTEEGERLIIEEFGRCLVQIIGCSNLEENNLR